MPLLPSPSSPSRQCCLRRRCRHRCCLHCRRLLSPSWRRSNGGAAMGREGGGAAMAMAAQQRRWVDVVPVNGIGLPPPCPTTIARPPSPRHLVRDLDLVVAPHPPSSVATAATAVFLLSPHLPHFLIVVSIVPPPTCASDVVVIVVFATASASPMSSLSKSLSPSLSSPLPLSTTTRAFLFITFECCVGIIDERSGGRGIVDGRSGDRCACCGRATMAEAVAAQRLWWQHSNGSAAMGRSNGREGGGAAMAMTAQRRLRRRSNGNGDGGAVMGVAVVAVAVAVVYRPPLFACGCSSAAPNGTPPLFLTCCTSAAPHRLDALLSLSLTSGMYFPILHIFNVGTPYRRTDRQTDDSLIISA